MFFHDPDKVGRIRLHTSLDTNIPYPGLVGLKVLVCVIGLGFAIPALASLFHPFAPGWQGMALSASLILGYTLFAHFFRPEPNFDEMRFIQTPWDFNSKRNWDLWQLHCTLGPGRFIARTFIEMMLLTGILKVDQEFEDDDSQGDELETVVDFDSFSANPWESSPQLGGPTAPETTEPFQGQSPLATNSLAVDSPEDQPTWASYPPRRQPTATTPVAPQGSMSPSRFGEDE